MDNLKIVYGDIIKIIEKTEKIDAVVNPNNKYMDYGSGVCGAIYDKAGLRILEHYCHNRWNKEMEVNEIRITPGFLLMRDIIHIYCPRYYEEKEPILKLKESYLKVFETIKKKNYKYVIIPSLGTGFHCYMHEEIAEIFIKTLRKFCVENKDITIIFNLLDEGTANIYSKYL